MFFWYWWFSMKYNTKPAFIHGTRDMKLNRSLIDIDVKEGFYLNDDEACSLIKKIFQGYLGDWLRRKTKLGGHRRKKCFRKNLETIFLKWNVEKINFYICRYGILAKKMVENRRDASERDEVGQLYYEDQFYEAALNNELYVSEIHQTQVCHKLISDYPKT